MWCCQYSILILFIYFSIYFSSSNVIVCLYMSRRIGSACAVHKQLEQRGSSEALAQVRFQPGGGAQGKARAAANVQTRLLDAIESKCEPRKQS